MIRPPGVNWQLGVWSELAPTGIRVTRVSPGSAAYYEGLETGDYIMDVNGYPVGLWEGINYPLSDALNSFADRDGWVNLRVWNRRTYLDETFWVQLRRPYVR